MATWLDVLDDPWGVRAVYGDQTPALGWVELHEVTMHRDGPRMVLRFDLPQYPARPPVKWRDRGCNTVQIQLMLSWVQEVSLQGWSHHSHVDLALEREGHTITATTYAGSTRMSVRAVAASITHMSAIRSSRTVPDPGSRRKTGVGPVVVAVDEEVCPGGIVLVREIE